MGVLAVSFVLDKYDGCISRVLRTRQTVRSGWCCFMDSILIVLRWWFIRSTPEQPLKVLTVGFEEDHWRNQIKVSKPLMVEGHLDRWIFSFSHRSRCFFPFFNPCWPWYLQCIGCLANKDGWGNVFIQYTYQIHIRHKYGYKQLIFDITQRVWGIFLAMGYPRHFLFKN